MTEKIHIEELPVTDEFVRKKRLIQDRGELALIEDGKPFQHLGYFSLKKGKGYYRGGHYHTKEGGTFLRGQRQDLRSPR